MNLQIRNVRAQEYDQNLSNQAHFEDIKDLKRFEFEAIEEDQEIAPNIDKL